jgi:hypothetical protein
MKPQPDNLFHSKLKEFKQVPPPMVWENIEHGLNEKSKRFYYSKIAAAVLFIMISVGIVLTKIQSGENPQPIASNLPDKKLAVESPDIAQIESKEHATDLALTAPPKKKSTKTAQKKKASDRASESGSMPISAKALPELVSLERDSAAAHILPQREPNLAYKPESTSVTIVITAEQTKEYLKESATSEATPGLEKTSTLKKLLKKASDLSTNQDPFGELRQKKNELLALSFRAEKRGQKK